MSDDTKALIDRLRDHENEGVTGSDRFHLRNEAANTIERLERDRDALAERCEKLREALVRVRAHTSYLWNAERDLLVGLLASIERITDTALRAAPKDAPNESRCTHKSSKIMRGIDNTYDVAWCDDCGAITWASDGCLTDEELHRSDREKWCESRVLAWGCAREADGANACKWWCGHPETCAVTLRADREMAEKGGK